MYWEYILAYGDGFSIVNFALKFSHSVKTVTDATLTKCHPQTKELLCIVLSRLVLFVLTVHSALINEAIGCR